MYNLSNAEAQFKTFLIAGNISSVSIRNYLSDFRYFFGWYSSIYNGKDLQEDLKSDLNIIKEYKRYLVCSIPSIKTINRRLSSLRKFTVCVMNSIEFEATTLSSVPNALYLEIQPKVTEELKDSILNSFRYDLLMSSYSSTRVDAIISSVEELILSNEAE